MKTEEVSESINPTVYDVIFSEEHSGNKTDVLKESSYYTASARLSNTTSASLP
ncbi:MAG TPA: hypothetical protein VNO50_00960 [Pyrinomonadaceae bacterium]|nr:hypothetical protein [Pyrinomonadaceae bacterium]